LLIHFKTFFLDLKGERVEKKAGVQRWPKGVDKESGANSRKEKEAGGGQIITFLVPRNQYAGSKAEPGKGGCRDQRVRRLPARDLYLSRPEDIGGEERGRDGPLV